MKACFKITVVAITLSLLACGKSEWRRFDDTKGEYITALADDGDVIWYGTKKGLIKMDQKSGKRDVFTVNNGLSDNNVTCITLEGTAKKWIGTSQGLSIFDGSNWDVIDHGTEKIPDDLINSISINNGRVVIGTGAGLSVMKGEDVKIYTQQSSGLLDNVIQSVDVDKAGTIWIGTQSAGLEAFDGKTFVTYDSSSYSPVKNPATNIKRVAIDNQGVKWLATTSGLLKFDGKAFTMYDTKNSPMPDKLIRDLVIDSKGNKWIATLKGLAKFDGTTWTIYNTSNSQLPADRLTAIHVGQNDEIWIGSENAGLSVFKEGGLDE